eukprot:CAMPEP_0204291474 /NCGR_PEP_ID=MMETSP0468-20130131/62605_1 /ASSEMBLY_ACC=CAM_ASM_000383 /TAXON_ID=2969 /ORGANISM="Oxyrrhis marina" /LENGTH=34 /DNA_ID= /DNA_START= /DNA_END= /DNA_ORIENTATION=
MIWNYATFAMALIILRHCSLPLLGVTVQAVHCTH